HAHGPGRGSRPARHRHPAGRVRCRWRPRLPAAAPARAPLSEGRVLMSASPPRFDLSAPLEVLHSNERVKYESRQLRGTLDASLSDEANGAVDESDGLLTKFFGIYQQDDRDLRDERRRAKLEPRYQFMVRVRLPGGVCMPEQWLMLD